MSLEQDIKALLEKVNVQLERSAVVQKENKQLKKTLFTIEKALLDFRLAELELDNTPVQTETFNLSEVKAECEDHKVDTETVNTLSNWIQNIEIEHVDEKEEPQPISSQAIYDVAPEEPEKKERKKRKERGGTVFKDFETLTLTSDNRLDGNSVIFSAKGSI
jgi:hypothetical protein